MTEHARLVLQDAIDSIAELPPEHHMGQPLDEATIRRRLVATIALLRAVGHVLYEVDGKTSKFLKRAIGNKWNEPKPAIFKDFIDQNRNAVLKRYEHPEVIYDTVMGILYPTLNVQYGQSSPVDFVGLAREAVHFWSEYLDDVDRISEELRLGEEEGS